MCSAVWLVFAMVLVALLLFIVSVGCGLQAILACDGMGDGAFLDSDKICLAGGTKIISTSI